MAETRPKVTIKEESIPSVQLFSATGKVALALITEKGSTNSFISVTNERDILNLIGQPTNITTSQDFNFAKIILSYGNDVVIRRIISSGAELPRIAFDLSGTGEPAVQLNQTADEKMFVDFNAHTPAYDLEFYAKQPQDNANIKIAVIKYEAGTAMGETWAANTDTIDGTTYFNDVLEFGPDDSKSEIGIIVLINDVIVESFTVSLVDGTKNASGENEYISDYLDAKSQYIWGFAKANSFTNFNNNVIQATELQDGLTDNANVTDQNKIDAYEFFAEKNDQSFDYITEGFHSIVRDTIFTIIENRKDCIGWFAPEKGDLFNGNAPLTSTSQIVTNIIADRASIGYTSWGVYIAQWVKKFDKYLGKDIWFPATADAIGNKLAVNSNNELWTPAAGTVRGVLRNIKALAFNPSESQQNDLYKNGCNHIVEKPGRGIILDGQKTMWNQPVGVSRLNIRELFRVVETYVGDVAIDFLHEFNDAITRDRFKSIVEDFLEDIKRRRGIVDYEVVADESLNTAQVIDSYQFRAQVKIKGNRPIEDITITFFDVPNGVDFNEI